METLQIKVVKDFLGWYAHEGDFIWSNWDMPLGSGDTIQEAIDDFLEQVGPNTKYSWS